MHRYRTRYAEGTNSGSKRPNPEARVSNHVVGSHIVVGYTKHRSRHELRIRQRHLYLVLNKKMNLSTSDAPFTPSLRFLVEFEYAYSKINLSQHRYAQNILAKTF